MVDPMGNSRLGLANPVNGYRFRLGLLKIRQVFKILPLAANHIPQSHNLLLKAARTQINPRIKESLCHCVKGPLPSPPAQRA